MGKTDSARLISTLIHEGKKSASQIFKYMTQPDSCGFRELGWELQTPERLGVKDFSPPSCTWPFVRQS